MTKNTQHYRSLDGLRGVAALSVVLLHYVSAFLPFLVGISLSVQHDRLAKLASTTPLQLPLAGNFAVCIFFVLSGFVLSLRFFQTREHAVIVSSVARRYFRLMIPALASVMLAYLMLKLGFIHSQEAAVRSGSMGWLGGFWNFPANFLQALWQGLYGIWANDFNPFATYNVVLWTMHYELLGSFLVFTLLSLFGREKNRGVFYLIFGLIFIKSYFMGFVAGVAICDIVVNQPKVFNRLSTRLTWMALPAGLVLGSWSTGLVYKSIFDRISVPYFNTAELQIFAHMLGAIIVVVAVLKLELLAKLLETKSMQYLGKISFPLYLTHFVIMGSLGCYVFLHVIAGHSYALAVLAASAIGMPASFMVAHYYNKYIDAWAIGLSKQWGNALTNADLNSISLYLQRLAQRVRRIIAQKPLVVEPEPQEEAI